MDPALISLSTIPKRPKNKVAQLNPANPVRINVQVEFRLNDFKSLLKEYLL